MNSGGQTMKDHVQLEQFGSHYGGSWKITDICEN